MTIAMCGSHNGLHCGWDRNVTGPSDIDPFVWMLTWEPWSCGPQLISHDYVFTRITVVCSASRALPLLDGEPTINKETDRLRPPNSLSNIFFSKVNAICKFVENYDHNSISMVVADGLASILGQDICNYLDGAGRSLHVPESSQRSNRAFVLLQTLPLDMGYCTNGVHPGTKVYRFFSTSCHTKITEHINNLSIQEC